MSLAHIRLVKVKEIADRVVYLAESPDFNPERAWQVVAEISISKNDGQFLFRPLNYWSNRKVVPPDVYALPEHERTTRLTGQYADHGFGAWTGRILSLVRLVSMDRRFPERAP